MNINEIIKQRLHELGYLIEDELGTGGFGITYLAIDKNNQETQVVIKAIKGELVAFVKRTLMLQQFNNSVQTFETEAKMLKRLEHPNIVRIYKHLIESFEVKDLFRQPPGNGILKFELSFPIMEYVDGQNLEELVYSRNSFLSEVEVLDYIQQIGKALILVHSKNILHRDIKPQNIMVRKDTNEAVLIDFGIARDFVPEITQSQTVLFTDPYAPPEQLLKNSRRSCYTDIYSLAATLYFLLTKELPISARERNNDSDKLLKEPKEINPNISDRVNNAIIWGMKLEPIKRPQKVEDWLAELLPDDLSSECNVDYTKLRDFLATGNWKDADNETYIVMLLAVHRSENDCIAEEEMLNFPCTDLRTINNLWVKYSNARFGFSVQSEIYLKVGGKPDGRYYSEAWTEFSERVGWRENGSYIYRRNFSYTDEAPSGHLPLKVSAKIMAFGLVVTCLTFRFKNCRFWDS